MESHFDLKLYGGEIRKRVLQWTGITCCVGIGPSKTLAKLANYAAKKYPALVAWWICATLQGGND